MRLHSTKLCMWIPPDPQEIKANTNGLVKIKPNASSISISFRDHLGEFIELIVQGLREYDIFWAERFVVVRATKIAMESNWTILWIETNSFSLVSSFNNGLILWQLRHRWPVCKREPLKNQEYRHMT